ncbi:hypothetical protein FBU30_005580 [Linnemannia zychae]|nr:hypothetical protein FBU30_005580 [Linnemannia zychae]
MPSPFTNQDFVLTVLAIYGATVAFNRWFPDIDLISVDAHPMSYVQTFNNSTESQLLFYKAFLAVDTIRVITSACLEAAVFNFALPDEMFEALAYVPFLFRLMANITKNILMSGCVFAAPEANEVAAVKVAALMPISVYVDQGFLAAGALALAYGLYQWTYAIGRDKRQVIKEKKIN